MSHSRSDHSDTSPNASSKVDASKTQQEAGKGQLVGAQSKSTPGSTPGSTSGDAGISSSESKQGGQAASPGRSRHQRRYRSRGRGARAVKKQVQSEAGSVAEKDKNRVATVASDVGGKGAASLPVSPVGHLPAEKSSTVVQSAMGVAQPESGSAKSTTQDKQSTNVQRAPLSEATRVQPIETEQPILDKQKPLAGGQSQAVESLVAGEMDAAKESSVASDAPAAAEAAIAPGEGQTQPAAVSDSSAMPAAAKVESTPYNPKTALRMPRRYTLANALRMLAVDAVGRAQSGHPGMPMGMADIAEVLWRDFLRHNPADPSWPDRDRFVISNGHGSMLLYGLLYLSGYDVNIEDIKNFRQLNSKTPGHPEHGLTPGVETTTGPLGQGLANAVGMAIAEQQLAAQYNRPDSTIINHFTYVFAGDGCMMEGVSHETCSLAGTLGLGKLIVFWDDNEISIDGPTSGWFTEDIPKRFRAYGWHVITSVNGHQSREIREAILQAQADGDRPTLICCKTQIGRGSPNMVGTAKIHGSPLTEDEVAATREKLNWPHAPFEIPEDVLAAWNARDHGARLQRFWNLQWQQYQQQFPEVGAQLERRLQRQLPGSWARTQTALLNQTQQDAPTVATRQASLRWLEQSVNGLPELIGGAADVSDSVNTKWPDAQAISKTNPGGNYIHYGVREFAMSAITNGLALHGGLIPFAGTYLVFSDYARNAIRMAALMKQPSIFIYSHDSIALGEDGPTHQPIEQLVSLRLIPGLEVWRPADACETMVAWRMAVERANGPTSLILTRQKVESLARTEEQLANIAKGAYIIYEPAERLKAVILSTGSEVQLAVAAAQALASMGYPTRVVSMPCCERFMQQDMAYQIEVMAPQITARISVECGVTDYWYQFIGAQGKAIGMDRFGESAPARDLLQAFGFTAEQITQDILQYLRQ